MSSPWIKIKVPEQKCLQDIMCEQLSESLRAKNNIAKYHSVKNKYLINENVEAVQDWYDDEQEESSGDCMGDDDFEEELENERDKMYWDKYDTAMRAFDPVPAGTHRNVIDAKKITITDGIDNKTNMVLKEMIQLDYFSDILKIISRNKEAIFLHAVLYTYSPRIPVRYYIVKIFKRRQFHVSQRNVNDHYRCRLKIATKSIDDKLLTSKLIKEKEYLWQMYLAGIPCPHIYYQKENVAVMSFIGKTEPASTLRDADLSLEEAKIAFTQTRTYIKLLYSKCNLVHTKLNADNILWDSRKCYIINLGSAIQVWEDGALDFLYNDAKNVCEFFASLGVCRITPENLFKEMTRCNYLDKAKLAEFEESIKKLRV